MKAHLKGRKNVSDKERKILFKYFESYILQNGKQDEEYFKNL